MNFLQFLFINIISFHFIYLELTPGLSLPEISHPHLQSLSDIGSMSSRSMSDVSRESFVPRCNSDSPDMLGSPSSASSNEDENVCLVLHEFNVSSKSEACCNDATFLIPSRAVIG